MMHPLKKIKIRYTKSNSMKKSSLIKSPQIQKEYNINACYVDILNKMLLRYWRRPQYIKHNHAYFSFFVHLAIHQAYITWKSIQNSSNTQKTHNFGLGRHY